ncbi:tRNA-dihydrouridine synthase family protein [Synergistaceae bacterium OttesenSCG-928-I11]|nr:tRNA-dihydrouridine synthase family protein [Synergistaceae bacterium OttesenSCG-928-I11]
MTFKPFSRHNIGGVEVVSPIWLAPLAGVTTHTFRAWHRKMGAGLVHTEMVSAVGLSYKNRKTADLIGDDSEPGPIVLQLFAPDAESIARGASLAVRMRRFDALEVNMACPMPKVTKKGSGAKLLEHPEEAKKIVSALKDFDLPVWVKLRITDQNQHPLTTAAFCEALLASGANLLMLHGRTPAQRYEGFANKEAIVDIAHTFPGRIVASGDYYAPADAQFYLDGGCVAVLAARGSLRDAYLIPRTHAALGYEIPETMTNPTTGDQIDALIQIGREGIAHEGERFTLVLIRRMLSGIFKGFHGASAIRQMCASCTSWTALEDSLTRLRDDNSVRADRNLAQHTIMM